MQILQCLFDFNFGGAVNVYVCSFTFVRSDQQVSERNVFDCWLFVHDEYVITTVTAVVVGKLPPEHTRRVNINDTRGWC